MEFAEPAWRRLAKARIFAFSGTHNEILVVKPNPLKSRSRADSCAEPKVL
jgi:hypothetical protein